MAFIIIFHQTFITPNSSHLKLHASAERYVIGLYDYTDQNKKAEESFFRRSDKSA